MEMGEELNLFFEVPLKSGSKLGKKFLFGLFASVDSISLSSFDPFNLK
jgi:hypothetical protein